MTAQSPPPSHLDLLERLVGFDTVSSRPNLPLIDFVADYLAGWGVASQRLPAATGSKASLFATIGPGGTGGVLLSGHTDVVPVEGQDWSSDPFRLRVADGRAYGRGAVDMKGFIALALAAVPGLVSAGLSVPVHLLFSYDEETSCQGSLEALARMGRDLPLPRIAIVGEPTGMAVVDAHKSAVAFRTTVRGREAHSSRPDLGASAVMAAGELVAEINRMARTFAAAADPRSRFDPPYTTMNVGTVQGGTAGNIVARDCRIGWEFRGLPALDPDEVLDRFARHAEQVCACMRRTAPESSIVTEQVVAVPALRPLPGSPAATLALELARRSSTTTAAFASEAGHIQNAGIPTIICGPGSIDQAHKPDEYITLAELEEGAAFLDRLVRWCADGANRGGPEPAVLF